MARLWQCLPIVFSHKCGVGSHALFEELRPFFEDAHQALRKDPFQGGDDLEVRMKTLPMHGLVFHCTAERAWIQRHAGSNSTPPAALPSRS